MKRVIISTNEVELGQKCKMRMSAILGSAKLSQFHSGVIIGEGNLDKVAPKFVKFAEPEELVGCAGGFRSPFGIFSIERLKDKPDYCKFIRVATWHQDISINSKVSLINTKGLTIEEVETPPLGEETITHRIVAEDRMVAVKQDEIGW